ncbi:SOS response-associated peptidase (plasmid) [Ralstonia pickettii]|uniref:SOS response-associated peptidase family protein n=1 Tax=Ralstonia TaxID=48736 RepID=UPI0027148EBF|nr:SOS response-associated peptidase family protein [Ralstonia pickettii]WKZ88430.1 SOS response-associated peptidase [Ralstonia pickettii]
MCYSAMVRANYREFCRMFGATISIREFVELYVERADDAKLRLPKAMSAAFLDAPATEEERRIAELIRAYDAAQESALQQELFKQTKRLADAERALQIKVTKKASEDQRIAGGKIDTLKAKLADLARTELKPRDARIFPGWYAPVLIVENGQRVIKPMRYQCRPAGKPAFYDDKYPGTYNARRDNLRGFWKGQYGHTHGLILVDRFYENVTGEDGKNKVLEFEPNPAQLMLVACLWSHWSTPGQQDLWSFAAITDEPPPEVAAAGHDRCIVPIKPEHVDAWLNPESQGLDALDAILDDRMPAYYEHRMAA